MIVAVVVIAAGAIYYWRQGPDDTNGDTDLIGQTEFELPSIGFAKVAADYAWQFPQDYSPHPDFQREQWQIRTTADCPTPFDLTFERVSVLSEDFPQVRSSAWATRSILTATLRQSETTTNRTSRAVIGLAGVDAQRVWVEDWEWNWATGYLKAGVIDLILTLSDASSLVTEGNWHRYTRAGQADNGCLVELIHQFGT